MYHIKRISITGGSMYHSYKEHHKDRNENSSYVCLKYKEFFALSSPIEKGNRSPSVLTRPAGRWDASKAFSIRFLSSLCCANIFITLLGNKSQIYIGIYSTLNRVGNKHYVWNKICLSLESYLACCIIFYYCDKYV